jgi:thiamine biosynthesis lipoprotein
MTATLEFRAMGCQMLAALDLEPERARRLLEQTPRWFETWESALSRFRAESEVSQLNRRPGVPVAVSEIVWSVLQAARRAEKESQGLVTPVLLSALVAAGYTSSFDRLELEQEAHPAKPPSRLPLSLRSVEIAPAERTVCLPQGLGLDFGGIAKGWAAHQAMRLLENYGPALVDAGGDIAISGPQADGRPWLVGIEDPLRPGEDLATLRLGRCGVATSGRDYRRWKQDGRWKHHIIDPRTGEPADTDVLTATVVAPNVMEAEMAAKVVLILGSQQGLAWLDAHPGFAGLVVVENREILTSRSFRKFWKGEHVH